MDPYQWNEFVVSRGGSFLQSWEWGELQKRLGRRIHRLAGNAWRVLFVERLLPLGARYWYAPYGPVIGEEDVRSFTAWDSFFADVRHAPDLKASFIRIEPMLLSSALAHHLTRLGLRSVAAVQPRATRLVDLTPPEEGILRNMEYQTRYRIRAAERRGVRILRYAGAEASGARFDDFWKLFEETAGRHHLRSHPKEYYRSVLEAGRGSAFRSELFIADCAGEPITAAIIIYFGRVATYFYSGSSYVHRTMNGPIRLIWEAMRTAKRIGCERFDLWGVSHENKKWAGITAFKKTFGGYEVAYGGAWDLPVERRRYALYAFLKRLRP